MTGRKRQQRAQRRAHARPRPLHRWRKLIFWTVGSAALVVVALLFDIAMRRINHPLIDASDVALVDVGRGIYVRECLNCHGASLQGQPDRPASATDRRVLGPPLDGSGNAWRLRDKDLFAITKAGSAAYGPSHDGKMPAFSQELSDREIAATLSYVKSLWPMDIQAKQARRNLAFWRRTAH